MTDQQPRPKVQRGISTVSQTPSRIGLKRGTSEAAQRAAVQRALSTISSKSGGKDKDTSDGLLSELQWQPSTEKTKPSLLKRILHAAGHASLILMLAVYTAAGGAAFVYFEGDNEKDIVEKHNQNVLQAKSSAKELMWSYVINEYTTNITAYEIGFKNELHNVLTTYDNRLYDAALNKVDVRKTKPDYQWHYKNSMFFSATVITTIGYGHIAPITTSGRVFCIIYALIGIPLTLIAIADMGKLFADFIQLVHKKWKKSRKKRRPEPDAAEDAATLAAAASGPSKAKTSIKVLGSVGLLILYIALGSGMFLMWEEWSYLESFYFSFITMTTIGLGDIVPEHEMYMLLCTIYILIGLAVTSTCIELARSEYEKSFQKMLEASKRLQLQGLSGISLVDTLRRIGDQIELHGEIIDLRLLQDLKTAIVGKTPEDNSKPPPIIIYETSV